jgi:two-component system, cell cycle response regulator
MPARILVVEDNPTNLDLMCFLLRSFGHAVLTASDGPEVPDLVRRERPDLVICDVYLPTMNGDEVVRQIKLDATIRDIPIVAVTAYAMVGDRERLLAAGFDGYISKPIEPESFIAQSESFLPANRRSTSRRAAPAVIEQEPVLEPPTASVLVVDDSPDNLDFIRTLLRSSGFKVFTESTIEGALDRARKERPDVVVCDVHLGQRLGYELADLLTRDPVLESTPCIMISSSHSTLMEPKSSDARVFILRPVDPEILLREIRERLPREAEKRLKRV